MPSSSVSVGADAPAYQRFFVGGLVGIALMALVVFWAYRAHQRDMSVSKEAVADYIPEHVALSFATVMGILGDRKSVV